MDMESISSVNSNYSSTESVKVKRAPVESAHTAAQSVSEASSAAVRTVSESGEATNQNCGNKEHNPSEATIDDAVKSANRSEEQTVVWSIRVVSIRITKRQIVFRLK